MLRLETGQMAPVELQTLAELFAMHSGVAAPAAQLSPTPAPPEPKASPDSAAPDRVQLIPSQKRRHGGFGFVAMMNGYVYHCDYQREGSAGARVYWKCTQRGGCGARLITDRAGNVLNARNNFHSHPPVEESQENGKRAEDKDEPKTLLSKERTSKDTLQNISTSSRKQNYQANLAFVREIHKRRHVLFGPHDRLNHADVMAAKERAWEEIREAVCHMGHFKFLGKDWRQLRANEWQQVRRAAMAKRYVSEMSGSKGAALNELDQLVLEIIGQEQNGGDGLDGQVSVEMGEDKPVTLVSPLNPLNPLTNPTDLFTTLLSHIDTATLQQMSQPLAQSASSASPPEEESSQKRVRADESSEVMRCSPSSSFDDVVDQADIGFDDLKLHYTKERYRLSIAQERARLDLIQSQLHNEAQLHELRLKAEQTRLQYEEMRLKREQERPQ